MLSFGKALRLQRCAAPSGHIVMFALDHRGNLKRMVRPDDPDSVGYQEIVDFKLELIRTMSPHSTGILLDAEYAVANNIVNRTIAPQAGLLCAVEKTGYAGPSDDRTTRLLPGWGVKKIARIGAAGVKLLVYYHPDAPNARQQEAVVEEVAESCRQEDIPFFLEPLSFSLDPNAKKLPSAERRQVVIATARKFTPMGVDILKAEFPVDAGEEPDESVWAAACAELSAASTAPWVLLSAGVTYPEFVRQTTVACQAGASGVLVGRSVWNEAVPLSGAARTAFLQITAADRMRELMAICVAHGKPWHAFHPDLGGVVPENWYEQY